MDYDALGPNSNSIINTILNAFGLNLRDYLPYEDNSTTDYRSPSEFPGHMDIVDAYGNNTYTAYAYHGQTTHFYKQGGVDALFLEYNSPSNHGIIEFHDEYASVGSTTVYAYDINFADVTVSRLSDFNYSLSASGVGGFFSFHGSDPSHLGIQFGDIHYLRGGAGADEFYSPELYSSYPILIEALEGNDYVKLGTATETVKAVYFRELQDVFAFDEAQGELFDPSEDDDIPF
ncbi:hypothetical protein D6851_00270 [Altericroceibacterium spongiae]|uniref:Uncharacterized protein n=1 Tax=Altericroceibacterium spongiae TaxID=2320269 RepID=A0A420EQN9_9SPHN|nr:hypothetical protein [Altericroceibacterium spongiae]RKF22992.1 hypothetical protein D6851_00270 [Altericroceibacterium spongiae]